MEIDYCLEISWQSHPDFQIYPLIRTVRPVIMREYEESQMCLLVYGSQEGFIIGHPYSQRQPLRLQAH